MTQIPSNNSENPYNDLLSKMPPGQQAAAASQFLVSEWKHEVSRDDTLLGYRDWLAHKIEAGDVA